MNERDVNQILISFSKKQMISLPLPEQVIKSENEDDIKLYEGEKNIQVDTKAIVEDTLRDIKKNRGALPKQPLKRVSQAINIKNKPEIPAKSKTRPVVPPPVPTRKKSNRPKLPPRPPRKIESKEDDEDDEENDIYVDDDDDEDEEEEETKKVDEAPSKPKFKKPTWKEHEFLDRLSYKSTICKDNFINIDSSIVDSFESNPDISKEDMGMFCFDFLLWKTDILNEIEESDLVSLLSTGRAFCRISEEMYMNILDYYSILDEDKDYIKQTVDPTEILNLPKRDTNGKFLKIHHLWNIFVANVVHQKHELITKRQRKFFLSYLMESSTEQTETDTIQTSFKDLNEYNVCKLDELFKKHVKEERLVTPLPNQFKMHPMQFLIPLLNEGASDVIEMLEDDPEDELELNDMLSVLSVMANTFEDIQTDEAVLYLIISILQKYHEHQDKNELYGIFDYFVPKLIENQYETNENLKNNTIHLCLYVLVTKLMDYSQTYQLNTDLFKKEYAYYKQLTSGLKNEEDFTTDESILIHERLFVRSSFKNRFKAYVSPDKEEKDLDTALQQCKLELEAEQGEISNFFPNNAEVLEYEAWHAQLRCISEFIYPKLKEKFEAYYNDDEDEDPFGEPKEPELQFVQTLSILYSYINPYLEAMNRCQKDYLEDVCLFEPLEINELYEDLNPLLNEIMQRWITALNAKINSFSHQSLNMEDWEPANDAVGHSNSIIDTTAFMDQCSIVFSSITYPNIERFYTEYFNTIAQIFQEYCVLITAKVPDVTDNRIRARFLPQPYPINHKLRSTSLLGTSKKKPMTINMDIERRRIKAGLKVNLREYLVKLNNLEFAYMKLGEMGNHIHKDLWKNQYNTYMSGFIEMKMNLRSKFENCRTFIWNHQNMIVKFLADCIVWCKLWPKLFSQLYMNGEYTQTGLTHQRIEDHMDPIMESIYELISDNASMFKKLVELIGKNINRALEYVLLDGGENRKFLAEDYDVIIHGVREMLRYLYSDGNLLPSQKAANKCLRPVYKLVERIMSRSSELLISGDKDCPSFDQLPMTPDAAINEKYPKYVNKRYVYKVLYHRQHDKIAKKFISKHPYIYG